MTNMKANFGCLYERGVFLPMLKLHCIKLVEFADGETNELACIATRSGPEHTLLGHQN